jgi:hypothetical protein
LTAAERYTRIPLASRRRCLSAVPLIACVLGAPLYCRYDLVRRSVNRESSLPIILPNRIAPSDRRKSRRRRPSDGHSETDAVFPPPRSLLAGGRQRRRSHDVLPGGHLAADPRHRPHGAQRHDSLVRLELRRHRGPRRRSRASLRGDRGDSPLHHRPAHPCTIAQFTPAPARCQRRARRCAMQCPDCPRGN